MHKILSKVSDSKPCINLMALIEFLEEGTVRGRCFLSVVAKTLRRVKLRRLALQVHWKNSPSSWWASCFKTFSQYKKCFLLNFGMRASSPVVLRKWTWTVQLDEEKWKYTGSAQDNNGISSVKLHSLKWLKATATLCAPAEKSVINMI